MFLNDNGTRIRWIVAKTNDLALHLQLVMSHRFDFSCFIVLCLLVHTDSSSVILQC